MQFETSELGDPDITPRTARIALAFVAGVLLFIMEVYFTLSEYYLESPPYLQFAIVGAISGAATFIFLRRTEPNRRNSWTYSAFIALAASLLAYPGFLRVNSLTATEAPRPVTYRLTSESTWKPVRNGVPTIPDYLKGSPWWQQFSPGDTYEFHIRQGGLGIWMIDMEPIYEAQRKFYDCSGMIDCMFVSGVGSKPGHPSL